jgi:hypothetical protein
MAWTKIDDDNYKRIITTEERVNLKQLKQDIQQLRADILTSQKLSDKDKLAEYDRMVVLPAQQTLQGLLQQVKEITGV